jgi:hypothetical protein
MEVDIGGQWPARNALPRLTDLDPPTLAAVAEFVDRLRNSLDSYSERVLLLTRRHLPGYAVVSDDDLRASARAELEGLVAELASLRFPDSAARDRLDGLALHRAAQGMPLETLSLGYRLGSREMLALMDDIAHEVGLPNDLVLAMHDSTWEFANEAAARFSSIEHNRAVERVRFDAERRSGFVRGVLSGGSTSDEIHRDADLFGLDPRRSYVPLALPFPSTQAADAVRRTLATALHTTPDRLLFADVGTVLGCIAPVVPVGLDHVLLAVGTAGSLDSLSKGFDEAVLALETAALFGVIGVVRLEDLGPKPLALSTSAAAAGALERIHFAVLDAEGRAGGEIEDTTRIYLECNQQVQDVATLLTVHPNTVRYRIGRFRELTGLDVRRTEDLVTAWWLLNRRRSATTSRRGGSA